MDKSEYNVYSKFDLEKHKATYIDYLEVVVYPDGTVEYAVPSHQEKMIEAACQKLMVSRDELKDMCPIEYYFDYLKWLSMVSGCMIVWTTQCFCAEPTKAQIAAIRRMRMAGVYRGPVPVISEKTAEKSAK